MAEEKSSTGYVDAWILTLRSRTGSTLCSFGPPTATKLANSLGQFRSAHKYGLQHRAKATSFEFWTFRTTTPSTP
ncbi:hypothetical protein INT44_007611 [Umbelopsis vinacea]|uniref:Uncharacterized protein n=1 Tax=Umbelopsis vinacea TaxID=44442 RepID=A0A8H7UCS0_9FUNG|nr:hypothetical protein INT44_007611 [Umbelopsis vinacea]